MTHEGLRLKPYTDTQGKLTIGVGRNLSDVGVSEAEAMLMLNNDIERVQSETIHAFGWYNSIGVIRQDVVLSMVFNLGLTGFQEFKKLIAAVACQDYERAASEMLDSKWAKQVGKRAIDLAYMMRNNTYPSGLV